MKIELNKKWMPEAFDNVKFAISAKQKKFDNRWGINYVVINNNKIISTDGHRLHIADFEIYAVPGLYEVIKNTKTEIFLLKVDHPDKDIQYPNIEMVIPQKDNTYLIREKASALEKTFRNRIISKHMAFYNYTFTIDMDFLNDIPADDWKIYFQIDKPLSPILFENGTKKAIIMPMRML